MLFPSNSYVSEASLLIVSSLGFQAMESGNPYIAKLILYKSLRTKDFNQFEIILMSYSALSASFEYPCYGAKAIRNIFFLQCEDRLQSSKSCIMYLVFRSSE